MSKLKRGIMAAGGIAVGLLTLRTIRKLRSDGDADPDAAVEPEELAGEAEEPEEAAADAGEPETDTAVEVAVEAAESEPEAAGADGEEGMETAAEHATAAVEHAGAALKLALEARRETAE
ncbi:hypothetical protein [Haloarchaeobius iranensis]|uniref:Uncharacterized protein n=1 Tax=Haloarchaeobius iranensis TaxID=996166 RepID=A0A1G9WX96_9EURY|nr:hypothetical protein [Haloarchaeobius iranensis]SDM88705.1 hypothetical protein SAMN05192554_10917 [Haloarchaeobius iranensis]